MPQPAVTPIRFSCLGPVALTGRGGARITLRTRKQTGLLLFFARRAGVPVLRDQALDLLWSEDEESAARHSLSQSVSLINKALGTEAVTAPGKAQLTLREGVVWLDANDFEAHIAAGRHAEARALWRGNLLDGFRVRRAPAFERWVEQERERLARLMRGSLREAAGAARSAGDWAAMRQSTETLLGLDGLDEEAMAAHLEALVLLGDRGLALRRYREFERTLRDDHGADPGPALRSWAQRQRRGDAPAPAAAPSLLREVPVVPTAPRVFGRQEEFAGLWQHWEVARAGTGTFLLLRGAAGIGKSALAAKLTNQVHVGGGATALVRCFRSEKSVPFAPVSALVRQLSRMPGFVALNPVWIGELSRLAPELRERFPGVPAPMAIDDSARARLCDATLHAAECVADEQPMLLVVDDLQDADEATLALLHYFGRMVSGQPAFLLGIARTPAGDPEFERSFVDTARAAGFVRILELGALPGEGIRRIVQQVLAQRGLDADEATLEQLVETARGNPLAAMELAMALPVDGGSAALAWLAGLEAAPGGGAQAFERTAAERLANLSADARFVAGTLALAGRPLADYDLAVVTALPTSTLASAILALDEAQFIRRAGAALAFAHERYRESAEAAVPAEGRRRIHAALAAFLAKSAATNPATRYEAAHHFAEAGRRREAKSQALAAARFAASVGAVRERAAALALACRVSRRYEGRLAADLGGCLLDLKEFERLDALCAEARAVPGLDQQLADEFRYLEIAADYHSGRAPLRGVQRALEALLASLKPGFPKLAAARSLLMRTADKTGDHHAVKRVARALRREPAPAGRRRSAHALFASAYVIAKYYWPARALPLLEEASRLAQDEQDWELEHLCRNGMGAVLKQLGRYRDSLAACRVALALARKTLDPLAEATSLVNIAVSEMALGRFEAAEEAFAKSAAIDERFPRWAFRVYRFYNQGVLLLLRGFHRDAAEEFSRARQLSLEMDMWPIAVLAAGGLGLCAQRSKDPLALATMCDILSAYSPRARMTLHDRWMVEACLAWNGATSHVVTSADFASLDLARRELARRDIDGWLRLECEAIDLRRLFDHSAAEEERLAAAREARKYEARAVLSALENYSNPGAR